MNNIILCGFMGSGKTTVGRRLAHILGCRFVDTDAEIERTAQMKTSQIFAELGEPAFRRMETETLRRVCSGSRQVISVGGGAALSEENVSIMKQGGTVVLLDIDAKTAVGRIKDDGSRPLLAGGDRLAKAEALLEKRRPLYLRAADIVIDSRNSAVVTAKKIADTVKM